METKSLRICLEELLEQHQRLLELAEKKKSILIQGNSKELLSIVHEEIQGIRKIQPLEIKRQELMDRFVLSNGHQKDLSLTGFVSYLPSEQERNVLMNLRNQLKSVVEKLKPLNDLNQQLIQQSLDYMKDTMELFLEGRSQENIATYRPPNQKMMNQKRHFFDSKM